MKKIILMYLFLFATNAFSNELKPVPVGKMDYFCSSNETVFWLGSQTKQVWISDSSNIHEGTALKNVKVQVYRCLNTFKFLGTGKFEHQMASYTISTHGCIGGDIGGSVTITDKMGHVLLSLSDLQCHRTDR